MACPIIKYGIPENGATEYTLNTGRELFRCGVGTEGCTKLYITNVTLEAGTVKSTCGEITGAVAGNVCMQSVNVNWKDQSIVNWIAKDGVTTDLASGNVITKADDCGGGSVIYTHTEGQLAARVLANFQEINNNRDQIINDAKAKLVAVAVAPTGGSVTNALEWVLSDLSINVSVTDWQGGSVTYQGFGTRSGGSNETYRLDFDWQNGRGEESLGKAFYDESDAVALLGTIVDSLISQASVAGFN